eukprot:4851047-Pyramimonas_sp.AAC.1
MRTVPAGRYVVLEVQQLGADIIRGICLPCPSPSQHFPQAKHWRNYERVKVGPRESRQCRGRLACTCAFWLKASFLDVSTAREFAFLVPSRFGRSLTWLLCPHNHLPE